MKRFSIIIPAYNAEKEIENTVKSVLKQNFNNYELIIVNDCSTDSTADIINQLAATYPQVKAIHRDTNGRAGGARNTGIFASDAEYIVFLDSDDALADENVLQDIDSAIGSNSPDLVYLGFEFLYDNNIDPKQVIPSEENSIKESRLTAWKYSNPWDICWNRQFMLDFNLTFNENVYYEDYICYYKAIILERSHTFVPRVTYLYTNNRPNSITNSVSLKHLRDHMTQDLQLLDLVEKYPDMKTSILKALHQEISYFNSIILTCK